MTVLPLPTPATSSWGDEVHAGLERILNSETFRKTPSLRHLLEYVVTRTAEGHAEQIKESVIAIDVFSRREDFDGRIDNIVRVQASRLRKLLETYYAEEGKDDKIRFSIPKGSYVPIIELKEEEVVRPPIRLPAAESTAAPEAKVRNRNPLGMAVAFLMGIAVTLVALALGTHRIGGAETQDAIPAAVNDIWKGIFDPGTKVIAAYTNPTFLRIGHSQPYTLMRYNGPLSAPAGAEIEPGANDPYFDRQLLAKGQKLYFTEGWTGTGEVLAVNRLTLLSSEFHNPLSVMPSRSLSLRDMHGANVVFLGSPGLNGALAQLGTAATPFYETMDGHIIVRQPHAGEPSSYANLVNETTREVMATYALFSVLPGMDNGRTVVTSAGLGTSATWSGIDFATSAAGAAQLESALKAANGGKMPRCYQAIVRAEMIKGTASNPTLVTVRVVPPAH
jgi:hypothetical protein